MGGKLGFMLQKGRAKSTKEGSEGSPPRAIAPGEKAAGAPGASFLPSFSSPTSNVTVKC